jgi:hypothetical protein
MINDPAKPISAARLSNLSVGQSDAGDTEQHMQPPDRRHRRAANARDATMQPAESVRSFPHF